MPRDTYPFMPAKLETMDGHYVVTALIPPFRTLPDLLLWGSRAFKLHEPVDLEALVYREAFAVAVVMTQEDYESIPEGGSNADPV